MHKNQRGQTSVEYILMIAAIVGIMFSVFGIFKQRFVGDGNCPNPQASFMCRLNAIWEADDPGAFKRYSI
tara:strand:- start:62 stop:271 length:210 start_codon:yes stop_codon:yes gene_type:complete